ncbi:DUF3833 family protein [uncultured Marinobacter sp.]|uniref:DUF3833 family protein n=1 Tax=uncultured Marinobacter sp. TaxID=187379 RepID=UPI00344C4382
MLGGCSGPALTDYAERGPKLIPEVFFNGELSARGVVKDMSGEVIRTFDADISASWNDAGDVAEPGTMRWRGNTIHMNYVLRIAYGDGTLDVRMDDWMYLITPDTLINQTTMSKWGVDVGELVLVIQKK